MKLLLALLPILIFADPATYEYIYNETSPVHILEVNLEEAELTLVNCDAREKTSVVAERYEALAALNGGFYKADGAPSGIFRMDHVALSGTDRSRGALGWSPFLIDRLDTDPETGALIPVFHPENQATWESMNYILGTTPVLIIDGSIPDFNEESVRLDFLQNRFPRTAMGIKEDGHLIFVLVKGSGMTIVELAEFMLSQGCRDAINLCGGSSSSLYFKGLIVHANELEEKSVGNVIIIKDRM